MEQRVMQWARREPADSHRLLDITPNEWEAFMDDFQQALDQFKVPDAEQAERKAIVNST